MNYNTVPIHSRIIVIGGGSASGKTTIATKLAKSLVSRNVSVECISMDNFYRSLDETESGDTFDWDDISALDIELLLKCINKWKNGRGCWIPHHDFATYKSVHESRYVHPAEVMIIEGIHALSSKLVFVSDLKIYVHCDHDEALARRITRDIRERQYSLELVLQRYFKYVKPALKNVIEPSQKNADFIIVNNDSSSGCKSIDLIADAMAIHSK